jgi:hypothetical protein
MRTLTLTHAPRAHAHVQEKLLVQMRRTLDVAETQHGEDTVLVCVFDASTVHYGRSKDALQVCSLLRFFQIFAVVYTHLLCAFDQPCRVLKYIFIYLQAQNFNKGDRALKKKAKVVEVPMRDGYYHRDGVRVPQSMMRSPTVLKGALSVLQVRVYALYAHEYWGCLLVCVHGR